MLYLVYYVEARGAAEIEKWVPKVGIVGYRWNIIFKVSDQKSLSDLSN